jgi:hypothetical protein
MESGKTQNRVEAKRLVDAAILLATGAEDKAASKLSCRRLRSRNGGGPRLSAVSVMNVMKVYKAERIYS